MNICSKILLIASLFSTPILTASPAPSGMIASPGSVTIDQQLGDLVARDFYFPFRRWPHSHHYTPVPLRQQHPQLPHRYTPSLLHWQALLHLYNRWEEQYHSYHATQLRQNPRWFCNLSQAGRATYGCFRTLRMSPAASADWWERVNWYACILGNRSGRQILPVAKTALSLQNLLWLNLHQISQL